MSTATAVSRSVRPRSRIEVLLICLATIVFDGYDLVVYGSTVPSILGYKPWGLGPAQVGVIGSMALVGVLIGTLIAGLVTDRIGRRRLLLFSIAWFSIGMLLTALAPTAAVFAGLRFLTGVGLGAIVPTCIALTVEYAPKARRQLANAVMFSGYSVGGVLAATLAIVLLPVVDFRVMYAIGVVPLFLLLPIAWVRLPESITYLVRRGRDAEARTLADQYDLVYDDIVTATHDSKEESRSSLRQLLSRRWVLATVLFAALNFCGLLLVYGLNTWLPQIMRAAGYPLGDALTFLLALNAGAIVGVICCSLIADRVGARRVVVTCFGIAAASTLLLSLVFPQALVLTLVALTGLGSVGTQILVSGFCASYYPQHLVPTALSIGLGVGRLGAISGPIVGGAIAASGTGFASAFYFFAAVAVLGAIVALVIPRQRESR